MADAEAGGAHDRATSPAGSARSASASSCRRCSTSRRSASRRSTSAPAGAASRSSWLPPICSRSRAVSTPDRSAADEPLPGVRPGARALSLASERARSSSRSRARAASPRGRRSRRPAPSTRRSTSIHAAATSTPEFAAVNPLRRVPALRDGDELVYETGPSCSTSSSGCPDAASGRSPASPAVARCCAG